MRFLALGDSYTIGESVAAEERWPVQLTALLNAADVEVSAPTIIAATGWTTDELSAGIDAAAPQSASPAQTSFAPDPQGPFDLVSLLIGVNNQYRGRDPGQYRSEFMGLLKRAIGFAGGEPSAVLVLSIPDWGVTPFAASHDRAAIATAIDAFNTINREEAERASARYIDVTPVSRLAVEDPTLIAADGLHPSGKMYAKWARLAFPHACEILK